jgi:hypothetical protein
MGNPNDVLPVGRFSPSPGLFVDRTENSVTISGEMELYGPEANAVRARSIQDSINTAWTSAFSDGYSVTCNITVRYRGAGSGAGSVTQIEAVKMSGPSHVSPALRGRSMTLNSNEPDAFTWTPAHEFGHIIGLQDRYSEPIISKIKATWGGTRTNTVQPGYAGNLMAQTGGALCIKNVADVATENEPSPYWINDDDQVASWVNTHPLLDVGRLSTVHKIKAITVLMGGWVSPQDMVAICKLCSSVTTKDEAKAIRAAVDPTQLKDMGQRINMRLAFDKMPKAR